MSDDLLFWIITFVVAGGGASLGAYLREKGKNYATKEDIRALTHLTESVKADVAGKAWVEQRRWDLKRDIYWKMIEQIDAYDNHLDDALRASRKERSPMDNLREANKVMTSLRPLMGIGNVILSDEAMSAFRQIADEHGKISERAKKSGNLLDIASHIEILDALKKAASNLHDELIKAAKNDLFGKKED